MKRNEFLKTLGFATVGVILIPTVLMAKGKSNVWLCPSGDNSVTTNNFKAFSDKDLIKMLSNEVLIKNKTFEIHRNIYLDNFKNVNIYNCVFNMREDTFFYIAGNNATIMYCTFKHWKTTAFKNNQL